MSSTERPTLSVAETADLLGISHWLVEQAAHDGSLPSVRVRPRILTARSRLLAWLDGQQDPAHRVLAGTRTTPAPRRPGVAYRTPHAS